LIPYGTGSLVACSATHTNIRDDYKWCERWYKFIGKNRSHHL